MKPVAEVENIILDLVQPLTEIESVSLDEAYNRILGKNISSSLDLPYWDNSAMDGYAVKFTDVQNASVDNPIPLKIVAEIPAGYCPQIKINQGETARIFTGGMIPSGSDTIVMQENTQAQGDQVLILSAPEPQQFVRHQGFFYQAGDCLLPSGIQIKAPEMAILATAQCLHVPVIKSPIIAILSTGDELITPEMELQPGQIIDSNQYLLSSFLRENGAIPIRMGIVADDFTSLKQVISSALEQADWVISTGGVSVGEYDYVDRVLQELGGKIQVHSVQMKPGKPLTVASFPDQQLYFGIPGNPVSTMVTCWRFLQTAIAKFSGNKDYSRPKIVKGVSKSRLSSQGTRESYLWGQVILENGYFQFTLATGSGSSGNLVNLRGVNALAVIPVGTKLIEIGQNVEIMLI
jgi:molybdopterin molybdotransferase